MPSDSRKALIVGIDRYAHLSPLNGAVNDAREIHARLERHADGRRNFDCRLLLGSDADGMVDRPTLRSAIKELFEGDHSVVVLYFAGHGDAEATGGYLVTSDAHEGSDGVALNDIFVWANACPAENKVIILDSCHAGMAGAATEGAASELAKGTTILAASTLAQYASEEFGSGVFTSLLIDALDGAAANLVGEVSPGSIYAHIDQSLGAWKQRPVFKANVQNFVSLRQLKPALEIGELLRLTEFFPYEGALYDLDPSFEPERREGGAPGVPDPDPVKTEIFAVLQRLNRVNLLVPVDAPHMWHAAMQSKACRLTPLGEHYRELVATGRI